MHPLKRSLYGAEEARRCVEGQRGLSSGVVCRSGLDVWTGERVGGSVGEVEGWGVGSVWRRRRGMGLKALMGRVGRGKRVGVVCGWGGWEWWAGWGCACCTAVERGRER